jgi:hypothetical protein
MSTWKVSAEFKKDHPLAGSIVALVEAANPFDARDKFLFRFCPHHEIIKRTVKIFRVN